MHRFKLLAGVLCLLLVWQGTSCSQRNYNVDAETAPITSTKGGLFKKKLAEPVTAPVDTARPSLATTPVADTAQLAVKKRKKRKSSKKMFLGYRIHKGYVKSGKGKNVTIEKFSYLKEYMEPSMYAPAKYYYDTKRHRIYKARTIDPKRARIVHGPYKKMVGGKVVSEGYFYIGTRHLRWESYNKAGILTSKSHFEKGFPRDAIINYYDGAQKKMKEVIPYVNNRIEGDYVMFHPNGLLAWEGQFEKGKRVGIWIEFYDFRNRKHYEYQYPETADDQSFEAFLLKEYDRNGNLIYEKGKIDKRPKM
jgi:antitoxin component YwqK of YwqJK toxin-antitoxin module